MKKTKKILVAASICTFALATAFGVQAPKTASAQDDAQATNLAAAKAWLTDSFTMEEGASARIDSTGDGLRFSADWSIDEAYATALETAGAKYGVIIAPLDSIPNGGTIDKDSVFGTDSPYYFAKETPVQGKTVIYNIENAVVQNIDDDAANEMTGALINLKTQNFVREYVGRAYVAVPATYESDGTTVATWDYYFAKYYGNDVANNTRSMYYVAQGLIEANHATAATLQTKYIDAYATTAASYTFSYTVNHYYNSDTPTTETLWGDLNATVNVADVLKAQSGWGYDATEQAAKNAKTSGRVYAGGRLALDIYYSQTVDTDDMTLADVGLAKASTFTGVEVANAPTDGIESVTYTYNDGTTDSTTVPTTAGKYTVTASFTVADGYLPVADMTASVRLVGDNATIGEHGANGFEINYTLASTTATAEDFTASANYIFMGMPSYEEAVANTTTTGSTVKLTNNVGATNFGTVTWNNDLIKYYGGSSNWFDNLENLAEKWYTNSYFYKKNLCYSTTVDDVTTYYLDLKLRVVNNDNGSTITLYVDHGNNGGTPIWGITSTKKIETGYAGLNYNACVEGRSYLSNFSVTELTANYKEIEDTYAVITSTDFEMSYTVSQTTSTARKTAYVSGGWNYVTYNAASDFAVKNYGGGAYYGEAIGLNGTMKTDYATNDPTWSGATWVPNNVTNGGETATITAKKYTVNKAFENPVTNFNEAPLNAYVIDFDNDGLKEVKFKWSFKNVTVDDTMTATVVVSAMNANGTYDTLITITGLDALTSEAQTVGLYYQNYGFLDKGFIRDFKVVCNDAAAQ